MNGPIFKNERTLASAGSGKTYALTNRFIALMLGEASADEICALTFTRKAAGEFFDKTIIKLAHAASDEKFAQRLSEQITAVSEGLKKPSSKDFLRILLKFIKSAPSLHLETIDSFISRYVRFFATELGLSEEIVIMDDYMKESADARVLSQTLARFSADQQDFEAFAETFRIANMGREGKSVTGRLADFVEEAHSLFVARPNLENWGNPKAYARTQLQNWNEETYVALLQILRNDAANTEDKSEAEAIRYIFNFFNDSRPKKIAGFKNKVGKALSSYMEEHGSSSGFQIPASRKKDTCYTISRQTSSAIDGLLRMLADADISLSCEGLRAVWLMMREYENIYRDNVRMRGLMSFSDLPLAVKDADFAFTREIVEYRFDSKFSHWLFDEFQDTSRAQWNVFENLISEAVLNSDGDKTFFYVGDVKQSVYAWRGGDPRLFDEIKSKFGNRISDNPQIKTSWRSCPAIIEAVNKIFGDNQAICSHFGSNAAKRWSDIWQDHDVAPPNLEKRGCVSIEARQKDEHIGDAVYEYIRRIGPVSRGLTCAVLTRRNSTAETIVERIRQRSEEDGIHMRAAGELEVKIANDNMAIPAMLALAKAAAHPYDTFAKEYAMMTPLKPFLDADGGPSMENFLKKAESFGFAEAFSEIAEFLADASSDNFTKTRIVQFMEMARIFDEKKERDIDKFLRFADTYKVREGAASDTIQVMSVHKAKGLDFDIVILPELENARGNFASSISVLESGDIVRLPSKQLCLFDSRLMEMREEIENKNAFENLCLNYVAFTRAKFAMHIILKQKSESKKADENEAKRDFGALLSDIFRPAGDEGAKIIEGEAGWFETFKLKHETPAKKILNATMIFNARERERKTFKTNVDFSETFDSKIFGICAHSILEKLSDHNCDVRKAAAAVSHLYTNDREALNRAAKTIEGAIKNPLILSVFKCENYWAERPYSIVKDGMIESGRFDRVNFYRDENRAEIIDYKSGPDSVEYRGQMLRYKHALQKLCGIENICLKILSLSQNRIIEI